MATYRQRSVSYGKISPEFHMTLQENAYHTISGLNNAGKSTVLQWLFSKTNKSIYIPAERGLMRPTWDTGTLNIQQYVSTFKRNVGDGPLDVRLMGHNATFGSNVRFDELNGYSECLLASLGRDKGVTSSINELNAYLNMFSLGSEADVRNDELRIDGRSVTQFGTGARSLLSIILALIHPDFTTILIDEPEIFLEPRAQKALRDLLVEKSQTKTIVAVTHSHLMLNRRDGDYDKNFYIDNELEGYTFLSQTHTKTDLRELTFKLLGASFDDLMLPENYLIVEGESDKIVMEKALMLIDVSRASKVQVAYVQGIQNALPSVNAISEMVRPYYAEDSVYKDRVVCLVDGPNNAAEQRSIREIERVLNAGNQQRMFNLGKDANDNSYDLEKIIPESLYVKATLTKQNVLAQIASLSGDFKGLGKYKAEVAVKIASVLEPQDLLLPELNILKGAAEKTLEPIS